MSPAAASSSRLTTTKINKTRRSQPNRGIHKLSTDRRGTAPPPPSGDNPTGSADLELHNLGEPTIAPGGEDDSIMDLDFSQTIQPSDQPVSEVSQGHVTQKTPGAANHNLNEPNAIPETQISEAPKTSQEMRTTLLEVSKGHSLKHSKWANNILEKPTDMDKPQGEMASFLEALYSQEERERMTTKALLAAFLNDVDSACDKAREGAGHHKCRTVEDITTQTKAFLKSVVVSQLGAKTVRIPEFQQPKSNSHSGGMTTNKPRAEAQQRKSPPAINDTHKGETPVKRTPSAPAPSKGPKTWAQVAGTIPPGRGAKDPKKANHDDTARALPPKPQRPAVNPRRVFLRLPDGAPQREQHPMFVVKAINSCLPPNLGVETATGVRTGFALSLQPGTTPQDVVNHSARVREKIVDGIIELDERWTVIKIRNLERKITDLDANGNLALREVHLEEEIYPDLVKAFGTTPESALWSDILLNGKHAMRLTFKGDKMTNHPGQIAIMGTKATVHYPTKRAPKAPLCQRCWQQHHTRNCKGEPACRICASTNHRSAEHPATDAACCANCHGEHPADSPVCFQSLGRKAANKPPNNNNQTQDPVPAETEIASSVDSTPEQGDITMATNSSKTITNTHEW